MENPHPELADIARLARRDAPITVQDEHLTTALDQLLTSRSQLTRVLLGAGRASVQ